MLFSNFCVLMGFIFTLATSRVVLHDHNPVVSIKRKIYANKELRYQIIGEAFGRLIMLIVIPLGSGLKVLSARPAPEYKEIYEGKAK